MGKLKLLTHPLIQNKITLLRCAQTGSKEFRELVKELAILIGYEATKNLPLVEVEIQTPLVKTTSNIVEKKIGLVPILRAGIGMADGMLTLLPTAKVGHIGLYRDPVSLEAVEYYCKLPSDICERETYILDPMLATGNTAIAAIDFLKQKGVQNISFLSIISCVEGVKRVHELHPDVTIYSAAHDEKLNDFGYILPGLGDAGDRIFGTK